MSLFLAVSTSAVHVPAAQLPPGPSHCGRQPPSPDAVTPLHLRSQAHWVSVMHVAQHLHAPPMITGMVPAAQPAAQEAPSPMLSTGLHIDGTVMSGASGTLRSRAPPCCASSL